MKLKQRPEDFIVNEDSDFEKDDAGNQRVYRLWKRGLSTLEVVQILSRRYSVRQQSIHTCGLKDKYAESTQLISLPRNIPTKSNDPRWRVEYLGRASKPVSSERLYGNRFVLIVRDLDDAAFQEIERRVPSVRAGIPNYFDSQRFGSARHGKGFVARRMIDGNWEGAVRLFLTATASFDRGDIKKRKRKIRDHWGEWAWLEKNLPYCDEKPVVRHLARHPDDWRGSLLAINRHVRTLLLFAFQSYIWNETLARVLHRRGLADRIAPYAMGWFAFPDFEQDEACVQPDGTIVPPPWLEDLQLPLVKHNTVIEDKEIRRVLEQVLKSINKLTLDRMKIPGQPSLFFKEIPRDALLVPKALEWRRLGKDDLNEGRLKGELTLSLPPGSFATLFTKALFEARTPAALAKARADEDRHDKYDGQHPLDLEPTYREEEDGPTGEDNDGDDDGGTWDELAGDDRAPETEPGA